MTVNLSEAKAHLGQYVWKAAGGEIVTICERNTPVAELHPVKTERKPRKLTIGILKGEFQVPDDFNEALTDFDAAFYGQVSTKSIKSK